ncbi:hypothetical protein J0S82_018564 [Galemys pyrenaicus]|uniref:Uncharacterized protein n=1 Tax=Galemys pyrenaicus TaxID=202257 RepID=A0A8J6AGM2_GALPY|nr:hypothetical protein J0S82_018564 [Galemys pyrenaicus]
MSLELRNGVISELPVWCLGRGSRRRNMALVGNGAELEADESGTRGQIRVRGWRYRVLVGRPCVSEKGLFDAGSASEFLGAGTVG